jgi:hypothetical protein
MKKQTLAAVITGLIGATLVFAACGSSGSPSAASENTFVLKEFTMTPPTNALHAGSFTITANNAGGEVHEVVIVRAASADALPKKSDGSVDEDKIAETDKVGEIEDVAARAQKSKTFNLAAGTYVAFCNLVDNMMGSSGSSMMNGSSGMMNGSGHVHFAEGMHVTFTVR